jgi:lipopolysaccharide transport system permease protein
MTSPLASTANGPSHVTRPRRVTVIRPASLSLRRLRQDLVKFVQYRDLLYTLSMHRIKVRYKQSVLGVSWAILHPLSLMLVYTVIFSFVVRMPSDGKPYALFAFAGLLPWTCFATSLTNATNGLVSHSELVTKVYFPRELLPLTYVSAALFDFLIASSLLLGLLAHYRVSLTWNLLYVVPIMVVLMLFASAMALCLSATQVRLRDIGVAMPLGLQLWMFATPVVYPLSVVPQRVRALYNMNPMVGVIENFRRVVVHGEAPDVGTLAFAAVVASILLAGAYVYFKNIEATVADII